MKSTNRPHIAVVGSVNTDMVVKGPRLPAPGETVTGGRFLMAAGGKGANQAVAAARLGAEVALVAKVGRDAFGDQAIENFRSEGIGVEAVFRSSDEPTGVALILVDEVGENLIAVAPGANHALRLDDIRAAAEVLRKADLVMLQLEIPMDTVECAAALAAEAGVPVILNPAPAAPLSDSLLRSVAFLTPNESEAELLTGVSIDGEESACAAAGVLLGRGARRVVITLGARGALAAEAEGMTLVPGHAVEVRDTTAAGDAFNGALACMLAQGDSLVAAVRTANVAGALAATRLGAQPSLPRAAEVERAVQMATRTMAES